MYTILIEPMQSHINEGTAQLISLPTYGKALSLFKEICDAKGLYFTADTIDAEKYPCEWTAGGIGHDYRITLTPDNHA